MSTNSIEIFWFNFSRQLLKLNENEEKKTIESAQKSAKNFNADHKNEWKVYKASSKDTPFYSENEKKNYPSNE